MDLIQYYANLVAQLTHENGVLKVTLEEKDNEIEKLKEELNDVRTTTNGKGN